MSNILQLQGRKNHSPIYYNQQNFYNTRWILEREELLRRTEWLVDAFSSRFLKVSATFFVDCILDFIVFGSDRAHYFGGRERL